MHESRWREFDFVLLGCAAALVGFGLAMVHSATCGSPCPGILPLSTWAIRQATFALLGFGLMALLSHVDYRLYSMYAYHLFAFSLALLVVVLLVGRGGADNDYGARRWIHMGLFDLQPSEFSKLVVPVVVARILADKPLGPISLKRLLFSLGIVGLPVGLVFAQPDLGTSASFVVIWLTLVLAARIRAWHGLLLTSAGLAALPLVWLAMKDYMRARLITYIGTLVDLEHAALDEGYNVHQARISIGSGGLFGRGYLEGSQTQLDYLRIKHSDFIFSALAEELGFIGAGLLFTLFILLIFRVTRAADRSRDEFGRYLALGIAAMLLFQAAANLGANLTLLPVTGIPLPFVSYGGTSLLTNLMALGIVESILLNRLRYRY